MRGAEAASIFTPYGKVTSGVPPGRPYRRVHSLSRREIRLSKQAEFKDYAALAYRDGQVAVVSQASARLWVARVDEQARALVQSGFTPIKDIEKIVRHEIFKEIWNEIDRLDQGVATARSSLAA
jgi:hypothetical protein